MATLTEDHKKASWNGKSMKAYKPKDAVYTRIESGDDWSKVYQHVCGVPTDGTEVQAEAFVLGNPDLILEISHADGLFKVRVPNSDGFSMSQIEPEDMQFPSWVLPQSGELVRYALVALPVAAETPSQRAVQAVSKMAEQLVQGDIDDSECGAGVPVAADIPKGAEVSEKPKVWLMRHRVGGHRVSSGQLQPEYNEDRDTWDVDESGWVKHIPDEIVPLIHPAHNLKPGECCEVPARETTHIRGWRGVDVNGKLAAIYDPGVFSDIDLPPDTRSPSVSIGNTRYWLGHNDGQVTLWERRGTEDAVCWHACNLPTSSDAAWAFNALRSVPPVATETPGDEDDDDKGPFPMYRDVTRVHPNVFIHKASHGYQVVLQVGVQYFDVCPRDDDEQHAQFIAAMLAKAVDKLSVPPVAPPVTVATAVPGPRWEKPRYRTVGEFICHINSEDYYVGAVNGEPSIIRVSEFDDGHQYLTCEHGAENSARLWVEVKPNDKDAKAYRQAYDTALAANKLPPHPRYPRPEGATDWLGWFSGGVVNRFDGWWRGGDISLVSGEGCSAMEADRISGYPGPWFQALARARELGLPERDARKARLADLERRRAEIDGKIAELREVSNA